MSHPIWDAIVAERLRQEAKWFGPHVHGSGSCASPNVPMPVKLAVLTEEVGEVARAYLDGNMDHLRTELVQTAAVCVAILESLWGEPTGG